MSHRTPELAAQLAIERIAPDVFLPSSHKEFNDAVARHPHVVAEVAINMTLGGTIDAEQQDVERVIEGVLNDKTVLGVGPNGDALWGEIWNDDGHQLAQHNYNDFMARHTGEVNTLQAESRAKYQEIVHYAGDRQPLINEYEKMQQHPLLVELQRLRRQQRLTTLGFIARKNVTAEELAVSTVMSSAAFEPVAV